MLNGTYRQSWGYMPAPKDPIGLKHLAKHNLQLDCQRGHELPPSWQCSLYGG